MFPSSSLTVHVLRGIAGLTMLATSILAPMPWYAQGLALGVGLLLLGGCPMCWIAGLFATWAQTSGGSCPLPTRRTLHIPPKSL